jgi:hypothetical protein
LLLDSGSIDEEQEIYKMKCDTKETSLKRAQTFEESIALIEESTSKADSELYWVKKVVWEMVEAALNEKDESNEQSATFIKLPVVNQVRSKSLLSSLLVLNIIIL